MKGYYFVSSRVRAGNRKDRAMFRRIVLAWVLVSVGGPSARAQVPYPRDLIPTRTALGRVGLEHAWFAAVPLVGTERLLGIDIADNLLFAQTSLTNLYTYDAESGQLLWSASLGKRTNEARESRRIPGWSSSPASRTCSPSTAGRGGPSGRSSSPPSRPARRGPTRTGR